MKTFIGEIVSQNPFTTASGIVETLSSRHDIETSKSFVYRTLRSKGFTFKKSQRTKVRSDLDIHHPFYNSMNTLYGEDTISVDESHFNAADCIRYGWGMKGERVHRKRPPKRDGVSLLLALHRSRGVVGYKIVTGSVKSDTFCDFLATLPDNMKVILDNATIHKTLLVRNMAEKKNMSLRNLRFLA